MQTLSFQPKTENVLHSTYEPLRSNLGPQIFRRGDPNAAPARPLPSYAPQIFYTLNQNNAAAEATNTLQFHQSANKSSQEAEHVLSDRRSHAVPLNHSSNAMTTYERWAAQNGHYGNFANNNDRTNNDNNWPQVSFAQGPPVETETLQRDNTRNPSNAIQRSSTSNPNNYGQKSNSVRPEESGKGQTKPVTYSEQIGVEIKVVFLRVMDINTLGQYFESEVYIQARWAESQFAGLSEKELEKIEFCQCWDPMLKILNRIGELDVDAMSMLLRYEEDRVYPVLTLMWHVQGLFKECLELQHFPFDVQELSVVISSERSHREVELVTDVDYPSKVHLNAMRDNQEWIFYHHVEFTFDYATFEMMSNTKHPILVASAHVKRRLGFYFWNIAIIVFLILGLSLTLLALDPASCDRSGVVMTLFLTSVAFKLVVKTTLPTISYLTYLDIYVVFTLMYLAMQAAENAIMCHLGRFRERDKVVFYDEIAQSILISFLLLFHFVFYIYIHSTAMRRRRTMAQKDRDMQFTRVKVMKGRDQDKKPSADARPPSGTPQGPADKDQEVAFDNPLFVEAKQTPTSPAQPINEGQQQAYGDSVPPAPPQFPPI